MLPTRVKLKFILTNTLLIVSTKNIVSYFIYFVFILLSVFFVFDHTLELCTFQLLKWYFDSYSCRFASYYTCTYNVLYFSITLQSVVRFNCVFSSSQLDNLLTLIICLTSSHFIYDFSLAQIFKLSDKKLFT